MPQLTQGFNESGATEIVTAGSTFNGASHDTGVNRISGSAMSKFRGEVFADQAGTLTIQHSRDGTTWRSTLSQTCTASTGTVIESMIVRRYVRATFHNTAGSDTTVFELDTLFVGI